jgi:hypothetical protein
MNYEFIAIFQAIFHLANVGTLTPSNGIALRK